MKFREFLNQLQNIVGVSGGHVRWNALVKVRIAEGDQNGVWYRVAEVGRVHWDEKEEAFMVEVY